MNRISIFRTGARFFVLAFFVALLAKIVGQEKIHPKFVILPFFVASLFFTIVFYPNKSNSNKLSAWSLFLLCFVSFYILLGVGFVIPLFFPTVSQLYGSEIKMLNIISAIVAGVLFFVTMISSFRSGEMAPSISEFIKNTVNSFDSICKKLNITNFTSRKIWYHGCSLESNGDYKDYKMQLMVENFVGSAPFSKITLMCKGDLNNVSVTTYQGEVEINTQNENARTSIENWINKKNLKEINFRAIANGRDVIINISEDIEDEELWQDFIELADTIAINSKLN